MISFTTTATVRPDLIDKTYSSFSKNLYGIDIKDCTLYINIDPIPTTNQIDVVNVAKQYFNTVKCNFPKKGNFPKALSWVWKNAISKYVFNLEDDWLLNRPVDINTLIKMIDSDNNILGVSLNAYLFNSNKFRIRLSPGLFKGSWTQSMAKKLLFNNCPELQLRQIESNYIMLNYPEYNSISEGNIIVNDIGRIWRESHKLAKSSSKNMGFTTWIKN